MHNPRISLTINDRMFTGTAQIVEQDKEPELTGEFQSWWIQNMVGMMMGWLFN